MNLTKLEQQHIKKILKREPNLIELKMFEALWNEHCSYKSTKKWLKKLYSKNELVLTDNNENAGIIDIGDNLALVFKIESHNHPSYIEPYNGAATGVGGILRDIFVMGARPIALMNSLRFGCITHSQTKKYCELISKGISAYSNSFGVPTVGGEVEFDKSYNNNILVNVFTAGIVDKNKIITRKTKLKDFDIYYIGAPTTKDGIGNAIMASANFTKKNVDTNIQIADAFMGRCCYEAFQELLKFDAIVASTDLGASGIACAITELGESNAKGIELNLNAIPTNNKNLQAEELLFSESQERILIILEASKEKLAQSICKKWNIEFAKIATSSKSSFISIKYNNTIISKIPINSVAPSQNHKYKIVNNILPILNELENEKIKDTFLKLIKLPNLASKEWFYNQFDSYIQSNTIIHPGNNCGVVKLENSQKSLIFKIDAKPNFCNVNAYMGTAYSIIKCWRAINSMGGKALAITNNLNFGSPTKAKIMGDIITTIKALKNVCSFFNLPIISGNVSLYNQTNNIEIKPTPVIAMVGIAQTIIIPKINDGDILFVLGSMPKELKSSVLHKIYDTILPYPPKVTLKNEIKYGNFVNKLMNSNIINDCQPMASGGILLVLAKLIVAHNIGITLKVAPKNLFNKLFSEENVKYIISVAPNNQQILKTLAKQQKIKIQKIGNFNGKYFKLAKIFNIDINTIINNFKYGIYNDLKLKRN